MIAIRELQASDLPFLVGIRNECRSMLHDDAEFTLAQAKAWFTATQPRYYVIACEGTPIGYFRTSNWNDVNRHVHIGCDLQADYRGKGLAQMAYRVFLQFLFGECGMNKVSLEVLDHNEPAKRLYRRLGFVLEGVKRQDVRRGDRYLDSLLMSMLRSEFHSRYGGGMDPAPQR